MVLDQEEVDMEVDEDDINQDQDRGTGRESPMDGETCRLSLHLGMRVRRGTRLQQVEEGMGILHLPPWAVMAGTAVVREVAMVGMEEEHTEEELEVEGVMVDMPLPHLCLMEGINHLLHPEEVLLLHHHHLLMPLREIPTPWLRRLMGIRPPLEDMLLRPRNLMEADKGVMADVVGMLRRIKGVMEVVEEEIRGGILIVMGMAMGGTDHRGD